MNLREICAIAPICMLCLVIGVMPQPLIRTIQPDIDAMVALYPSGKQPVAGATDVVPFAVAQANLRVPGAASATPQIIPFWGIEDSAPATQPHFAIPGTLWVPQSDAL